MPPFLPATKTKAVINLIRKKPTTINYNQVVPLTQIVSAPPSMDFTDRTQPRKVIGREQHAIPTGPVPAFRDVRTVSGLRQVMNGRRGGWGGEGRVHKSRRNDERRECRRIIVIRWHPEGTTTSDSSLNPRETVTKGFSFLLRWDNFLSPIWAVLKLYRHVLS